MALDLFDEIGGGSHKDLFGELGPGQDQKKPPEQEGILQSAGRTLKDVAQAPLDLPAHLGASFAAVIEGSDPYAEQDWKDSLINYSRDLTRRRAAEPGGDKEVLFGITRKDIRELPQNLAFSLTSAGPGLAAGVGTTAALTAAGGGTTTPAAAVAGYAAGAGVSGAMAYRMDRNQFLRETHDVLNEEYKATHGTDMPQEEWQKRMDGGLDALAAEHGLYEAIPEAIGNVLDLKILRTPAGRLAGGMVRKVLGPARKEMAEKFISVLGEKAAAKFLTKMAGIYGTELGTEMVTQTGQHNVEVEAGTQPGEKRSWVSPSDYWDSLSEVAPSVFLLTSVMGGAGYVASHAYDKYIDNPRRATLVKDAVAEGKIYAIPDATIGNITEAADELAKAMPNDPDLAKAAGALKAEKARRAIIDLYETGAGGEATEIPTKPAAESAPETAKPAAAEEATPEAAKPAAPYQPSPEEVAQKERDYYLAVAQTELDTTNYLNDDGSFDDAGYRGDIEARADELQQNDDALTPDRLAVRHHQAVTSLEQAAAPTSMELAIAEAMPAPKGTLTRSMQDYDQREAVVPQPVEQKQPRALTEGMMLRRTEYLQKNGIPFQVIPHPTQGDRFAVVVGQQQEVAQDGRGAEAEHRGAVAGGGAGLRGGQGTRSGAETPSGSTQNQEAAAVAATQTGGIADDRQNQQGLSGSQRIGQEPVSGQPERVGGEAPAQAGGILQAPSPGRATEAVAQEFTPTHELEDGTPVASTGEPGVYVDSTGAEWEDSNATPIVTSKLDEAAHEAATSPTNELAPSKDQLLAGNAKMGHHTIHGVGITVENPAGSVREDLKEGKWARQMVHHYGYAKRTLGNDGDNVDVIVRNGYDPEAAEPGDVYVVDQNHPTGEFDEHKAVIGFDNLDKAREGYLSMYEQGWDKNIRSIAHMSWGEWRQWLKEGDKKQPAFEWLAKQRQAAHEAAAPAKAAPAPAEKADHAILPIGKHKGESVYDVAVTDPDHLKWLLERPNFRKEHKRLTAEIRKAQIEAAKTRRPDRRVYDVLRDDIAAIEDPAERAEAVEELRRMALTDHRTGLASGLALQQHIKMLEKLGKAYRIASLDVAGLKWVNDNMNPAIGDELIAKSGELLNRANKGYGYFMASPKGDEFYVVVEGESDASLRELVTKAQEVGSKAVLSYTLSDGTVIEKQGIDLYAGYGETQEAADADLNDAKATAKAATKAEREAAGIHDDRLAEPRGVVRKPAEGREAGSETPAGAVKEPKAVQKPATAKSSEEKPAAAKDIPILPGDRFYTLTGRMTEPYPKYSTKGYNKRDEYAANQWLINEYLAEAESRGDKYNATIAKGMNNKNLSPADIGAAHLYLFDDMEGRIGSRKVGFEQEAAATPAAEAEAVATAAEHVADHPKVTMAIARKDLIAQLNAAMKKAKDVKTPHVRDFLKTNVLSGERDFEDAAAKIGYITLDVEGDGTFKILNTKDRIAEVIKMVNREFSTEKQYSQSLPAAESNAPSSFTSSILEMLNEGEVENAYYMAQNIGAPLYYGTPIGSNQPVPYVNVSEFDHMGYRFFVGKGTNGKWVVTELTTGMSAIGNVLAKTKAQAIDNAKKLLDKTGQQRVDGLLGHGAKHSQAELEEEFKAAHLFGKEEEAATAVEEAPVAENEKPLEAAPAKGESEKIVKKIAKLRDIADGMENQIQEKLHPAIGEKNITARRSRIASGMAAEGERLQRIQAALRGIADAIEADTLPESLVGITTMADVETLLGSTKFPVPFLRDMDKRDLLEATKGIRGTADARATLERFSIGDGSRDMTTKVMEAVEELNKAAKKASKDPLKYSYAATTLASYKRMVRAGVTSEAQFTEARDAIKVYADGAAPTEAELKAKKLKELERNLLGNKIPGFFPTTSETVSRMIELADIRPGMTVLEPEAGAGNMADVIRDEADVIPDVIEISGTLRDILELKGYPLVGDDMLEYTGKLYDRIIMNPPFEKGQDMEHVRKAYDLLNPGGRLVAIMSEGTFFRTGSNEQGFREWLDEHGGEVEDLEAGTFNHAKLVKRTGVKTRIVTIDKPMEAIAAAPEKAEPKPQTTPKAEEKPKVSDTGLDGRRAKSGGERGLNGEWYAGGQFMPTSAFTINGAIKGAKGDGSGRVMVEPGVWAVPPAGEFSLYGRLRAFVTENDNGTLSFNSPDSINWETFFESKEEADAILTRYNQGQRYYTKGKSLLLESKEKIEDFGEKIGGARKDMSIKTGQREGGSTKKADNLPRWRKRYRVTQIAKEAVLRPGQVDHSGQYIIIDERTDRQIRGLYFDTEEQAETAVPMVEAARNHAVIQSRKESAEDKDSYEIVRKVTDRKRVTIKAGFESRDEAMKYLALHAVEIVETKTRIDDSIHPVLKQAIRIGDERRAGDRDVGANDFMQIFGFRGVEFGNWNNQAERQHIMNQTYDALLDMADILNVPPRAISLNGELAVSFGSRGHGLSGAQAHYEPSYAVINLTKIRGAGALAHEWLHAFDNYLARQAGKTSSEKVRNENGDMVYPLKKNRDDLMFVSYGFGFKSEGKTRQELREAFDKVMEVIRRREMEYTEDSSKRERIEEKQKASLENTLQNFRAQLTAQLEWGPKKYRGPATEEQLTKVDAVLDRIRKGEYGEVVHVEPKVKAGWSQLGYYFRQSVVELSELYREIRGSQGYSRQQGRVTGWIQDIENAISLYQRADASLKAAQEQKVLTKKVATEYYSEAWRMDQGATIDYWSTDHEIAARAFGAYIYDRLKGYEARNDFLAYEQHNNLPEYRMFQVKPYPEGAEREAIDAAFDNLFKVLKNQETDNGVMLFHRSYNGGTSDTVTDMLANAKAKVRTINAEILPILQAMKNPPKVNVLETARELPARAVAHIEVNGGYFDQVKGWFDDKTGEVYLVAENMGERGESEVTLLHEVVGHYGLRAILGEQYAPIMRQVYLANRAAISNLIARNYPDIDLKTDAGRVLAAEEFVAHQAQTGLKPGLWDKLVALVKSVLRNFVDLEFAGTDIAILIGQARQFVETGKRPAAPGVVMAWNFGPFARIHQAYLSIDSSRNIVPRTFKWVAEHGGWNPGDINFDIGGGRFDKFSAALEEEGVVNLAYYPGLPYEHNQSVLETVKAEKADTVTVNNVLNVIKEPEIHADVISLAAASLKPDGAAYFLIYHGPQSQGEGVGMHTAGDTWQENKPTDAYVEEIKEFFGEVEIFNLKKGKEGSGIIVARKPKVAEFRPTFARRISEELSYEEVAEFADTMMAKYAELDTFDLHPVAGGGINLGLIIVESNGRNKGIGSKVMEDLTDYADSKGQRIYLDPAQHGDPGGTTSRGRLVRFYRQFGFVENKGRNKDWSISYGMYREPAGAGAFSRTNYPMVTPPSQQQRNQRTKGVAGSAADIIASLPDEVRERLEEGKKGLADQRPLLERIRDHAAHLYAGFTRHWIDLPVTAQFAQANEALRQMEAAPQWAKDTAVSILDKITKDMTPEDYDLFSLKVLLDDLSYEASIGHDLPFGFTADTLADAKAGTDRLVDGNELVKERLAVRKSEVDTITSGLVKRGILGVEAIKNPAYFRHQVLTYARVRQYAQGAAAIKKPRPGYAKHRAGSLEDINANYIEAEFEFMQRALVDMKMADTIKKVQKFYDLTEELKQQAKETGAANWKDLIPSGYEEWQPEPGNIWYRGKSVTDQALDEWLDSTVDIASQKEILPQDIVLEASKLLQGIRGAMVMGGRKTTFVLPSELATTMRKMRDPEAGLFDAVLAKPLAMWKQWVLINPHRVLKYNLNNMSGDLDAAFAAGIPLRGYLMPAIKELYGVMKGGDLSARYSAGVERGVFDSGLSIQEIPEINALEKFARLNIKADKGVTDIAGAAVGKTWEALQDYTRFRENWLRLAAFNYYADRLEAGETLDEIGWGASNPEIVEELMKTDPLDAAALLAREAIGDYGNVSAFGMQLRKKVIPFYSWLEVNTGRYIRIFRNAYKQAANEREAQGIAAGTRAAASLFGRIFLLYGAIQLWNNLLHGDDEDELDVTERVRMHLNLGKDEDGMIRTLRLQGALSDFLAWFAFEDAVATMVEVEKGRADMSDVLTSIAKGPINKVAGGITPVIKTPMELLSGQSFWPDIFNPRAIRDRKRDAARLFSLENEYDWLTGKPTRGYWRSWSSSVVYEKDAGEIAYDRMRGLVHDWNRKVKGVEGSGSYITPRSDALRNYRMALRYGDQAAAKRYRAELAQMGVDWKDLNASVDRAHPLGSISKQDRMRFMATLSAEERRVLSEAVKWYNKVYR